MQSLIDALIERVGREPAVLVSVQSTQGSVPREAGTWMGVFADGGLVGTIGGGHLEFEAIELARRALAGESIDALRRFALGPSLGQCCGGVMHLRFEPVQPADAAFRSVQPRCARTHQTRRSCSSAAA